MKVTLTAEMKKVITISEMPAVNKVIAAMQDDATTVKEYAEQAARIAGGHSKVKVLEASAKIAKNCRRWDDITDGTADMDVWLDFTAIIDDGYGGIIMGGAYITDIWQADGENSAALRNHMYIRKFAEIR